MASSFDALPPEIAQKCVEFLDFDFVSGELKGVSKATRGMGRGLGTWSDPKLAARFTREYLVYYGHRNNIEMHDTTARAWSDDWEDRTKANAFIAEMGRIWNAYKRSRQQRLSRR